MSLAAVETVLDDAAGSASATEAAQGDGCGETETGFMLRMALALTGVGACLCDAEDRVRYLNESFRTTMFSGMRCEGERFSDLIRAAVLSAGSVRLDSMPLDRFVIHVREGRRQLQTERAFPVDLKDGRWLYLTERKLPNGWILVLAMDISSLKHEEFRLRAAHESALLDASTDPLTAIANRRHGLKLAEDAIAAAQPTRRPLSIAIVDIDHFKRINDTFGHHTGDRVLVDFAALLVRRSPPPMAVARIGGEEFLVVMPGTTAEQGKMLLEGVLRDLMSAGLRRAARVRYTFSAGVSELCAGEDLDALLSRADDALYGAKRDGRSRVDVAGRRSRAASIGARRR